MKKEERRHLEAVLIGLQDGVDLRRGEDVALEGPTGAVTPGLQVVSERVEQDGVLGARQQPEQLGRQRHGWRGTEG